MENQIQVLDKNVSISFWTSKIKKPIFLQTAIDK